jgi:hypothetical protein
MDVGANSIASKGTQTRWAIVGAFAFFAVAAGLLIFSLSQAGAATSIPL